MQKELLLRDPHMEEASNERILLCKDFKEALHLCKTHSGLQEKAMAIELNIDPPTWSRIWSNQIHFPEEKLESFMTLCRNLIPLRYIQFLGV